MAGAGTTTQVGGYGGGGGAGGDLLSTNNLSDVASAATSRTNLGFSTLTDYVTLTGTQTLTNKTLTTPKITDIKGSNGNSVVRLTDGGSSVNYWDAFASNTGAGITIRAGGTDTNITANFYGKGTGSSILGIATGATAEVYGVQVGLYSTSGTFLVSSAGIAALTTTTANTATVTNVEQRSLATSGTAATGLGLSKQTYIEVSGGSSSLALTESVYLTDGTSGAANVLWALDAGSSTINAFEILGASGIKMGGSTSGYVTIKPSATAGDWTFTLPANDGTSGQYLKTDGSGNTSWDTPSGGSSGVGTSVAAYKSSDETVTSSTTLQNDDTLVFAIAANETWTGVVNTFTSAHVSGGMKWDIAIPSGATGTMMTKSSISTFTHANVSVGTGGGATQAMTATNTIQQHYFTVVNGANAGNVQFRWAQNASLGTGTVVAAGSTLFAIRTV